MQDASIMTKPTTDIINLFCSPRFILDIGRRVSFNLLLLVPYHIKTVNIQIYTIVITSAGFANPKGKTMYGYLMY